MENIIKNISVHCDKKLAKQYINIKSLIILGCLLVSIVILFLTPILTYTDDELSISITGINIITSLFRGGKIGYSNFGNIVWISIPLYFITLYLIVLTLLICLAIYTAINIFIFKKDIKFLSYTYIGIAFLTLAIYVILLVSNGITSVSLSGEQKSFYKLFELSITFVLSGVLCAFAGAIQFFLTLKNVQKIRQYLVFYLLLIIPTICILIFSIYPIILQLILTFKEYKLSDGIWGSTWIGFENIKYIFQDPTMLMVIKNTLWLSFLRLIVGVIPPVFFAILFYDMMGKKYRNVVQTVVYIPHFFSWVIVYAIVSTFLMPSGIVNNIIVKLGGTRIDFLSTPSLFYPTMILSSVWKEVGWGTILYFAGLCAIDKSLFEAAEIDGAGPMKKLFHITLPGIMPVIIFQTIMAVGNLLKSAGGEQILIFATGAVKNDQALVIDTWLYWQGLNELKYGLSAAVSFLQSAIGLLMVLCCNNLSKKLVGIGAW